MSDNHIDPDIAVEVFVFERLGRNENGSGADQRAGELGDGR